MVDIWGLKNADSVMLVRRPPIVWGWLGVKAKDLATVQNAARGVAALRQAVADGLQ